jgi:hypothetical protein
LQPVFYVSLGFNFLIFVGLICFGSFWGLWRQKLFDYYFPAYFPPPFNPPNFRKF